MQYKKSILNAVFCIKNISCKPYLVLCEYEKIRIGYVLKSADVGTLFSSRYSENSSHAHTRRHPHTFTHTSAHLCTPMHTRPPLRIPTHTLAYQHTPAVVVELIVVVDEFELINHM